MASAMVLANVNSQNFSRVRVSVEEQSEKEDGNEIELLKAIVERQRSSVLGFSSILMKVCTLVIIVDFSFSL